MGRPVAVEPAGRVIAGMPAVDPGPVLRMVVRKTGTCRPFSSVVSSSPTGGAARGPRGGGKRHGGVDQRGEPGAGRGAQRIGVGGAQPVPDDEVLPVDLLGDRPARG